VFVPSAGVAMACTTSMNSIRTISPCASLNYALLRGRTLLTCSTRTYVSDYDGRFRSGSRKSLRPSFFFKEKIASQDWYETPPDRRHGSASRAKWSAGYVWGPARKYGWRRPVESHLRALARRLMTRCMITRAIGKTVEAEEPHTGQPVNRTLSPATRKGEEPRPIDRSIFAWTVGLRTGKA